MASTTASTPASKPMGGAMTPLAALVCVAVAIAEEAELATEETLKRGRRQ
jgi:hypothetical protein